MQDTGRRPSWFSSLFGRSGGGGGANPAHSAAASGRSALTGAPANFTGVAANVPSLAGGADEAGGAGSDDNSRRTNCLAEVRVQTSSPKFWIRSVKRIQRIKNGLDGWQFVSKLLPTCVRLIADFVEAKLK